MLLDLTLHLILLIPLKMEPEHQYKFLLLDFGHPMNIKTTENVINSLENVLALGAAFPKSTRQSSFGLSIVNWDFAIFRPGSELCESYDFITTKLEAFLKTMNTSNRITVQEYKYLMSKSIQAVLQEFQKFRKCDSRSLIEITVITKKTATVLADIIRDIKNQLHKVIPSIHSNEKYKIVQILGKEQEKNCGIPNKNFLIDCTSCTDNINALNCFFKDSLLNSQQRLRIVLSEAPDFGVECDTEDCIINTVSLIPERKRDPFNELCSTGLVGTSKLSYNLRIINRFPVGGFCPTLVFGIPRRVYATRSDILSWSESQNNSKIFSELCRELNQTEQGLLAKDVLPTGKNCVTTFHLLTSDGESLLLNDVSPEELYLPNKPLQSANFCGDAASASLVKRCLKKIEYLNEYQPKNFSSGLYDHLRHHLAQIGRSKNTKIDPDVKILIEKNEDEVSKELSKKHQIDGNSLNGVSTAKKKRQMVSKEVLENIHPALLTPNAVEKYKKIRAVQKKNLKLNKTVL